MYKISGTLLIIESLTIGGVCSIEFPFHHLIQRIKAGWPGVCKKKELIKQTTTY